MTTDSGPRRIKRSSNSSGLDWSRDSRVWDSRSSGTAAACRQSINRHTSPSITLVRMIFALNCNWVFSRDVDLPFPAAPKHEDGSTSFLITKSKLNQRPIEGKPSNSAKIESKSSLESRRSEDTDRRDGTKILNLKPITHEEISALKVATHSAMPRDLITRNDSARGKTARLNAERPRLPSTRKATPHTGVITVLQVRRQALWAHSPSV